jgi:hypothetical protein
MRRNYISPEFLNNKIYGTYNMIEESNFFGSKMMDIEDMITIDTQDIIYYQKSNGEQIDFAIESSIQANSYSSSLSKQNNHTLVIDSSQPKYQFEKNTRWILTIDIKTILQDFLFATMKRFRTFEGVRNEYTRYNDVNVALKKYIEYNVLDRYKFKSVDLFISYKDLRRQNILKWKNSWNVNTTSKFTKFQTETAFDGSSVKIMFNQEQESALFNYDYYFNLSFEKI